MKNLDLCIEYIVEKLIVSANSKIWFSANMRVRTCTRSFQDAEKTSDNLSGTKNLNQMARHFLVCSEANSVRRIAVKRINLF